MEQPLLLGQQTDEESQLLYQKTVLHIKFRFHSQSIAQGCAYLALFCLILGFRTNSVICAWALSHSWASTVSVVLTLIVCLAAMLKFPSFTVPLGGPIVLALGFFLGTPSAATDYGEVYAFECVSLIGAVTLFTCARMRRLERYCTFWQMVVVSYLVSAVAGVGYYLFAPENGLKNKGVVFAGLLPILFVSIEDGSFEMLTKLLKPRQEGGALA